ncbi:hypothetical protein QUB80_18170 [Chlorogloeopsis sp. ULAP01]|uniref:hypothetical protein n=1 Tax=Chlorogloeopsis sp. ULAP01 TaxID=3056483 RepID=UPI0025AABC05|nr:hypothetical protein [Chlorogloeopsis sp. ULAP01]MDM9382624.1 hypothetical protein [Chlorogloeopsis sp. ULAP01]
MFKKFEIGWVIASRHAPLHPTASQHQNQLASMQSLIHFSVSTIAFTLQRSADGFNGW